MRGRVAGTWGAVLVAAAGCGPPPLPVSCSIDAGADGGATCGPPPAPRDPSAVDDMAEFRRVTSALVCERAFDCEYAFDWALAESYCHPRFAELQALRSGATGALDVTMARAALAALIEAPSCELALDAAQRCRMISEAPLGTPCADHGCGSAFELPCRDGMCALGRAGDACTWSWQCELGLDCVAGGICAALVQRGGACTSDGECAAHLGCFAGRCDVALLGGSCTVASCAAGTGCDGRTCAPTIGPGDCCGDGRFCAVGECRSGFCAGTVPLGCACESSNDCPFDVSACVDGVCQPRPFLGEPCPHSRLPCFASICDGGVCRLAREGEGCRLDADCDGDLVCPRVSCRSLSCPLGRCGPVLDLGEPCGTSEVLGRCADGLVCGYANLCGPLLGATAPCGMGVLGDCETGLYCDVRAASPTCQPRAGLAESCSTRPCVEPLVCGDDGYCRL